MKTRVETALYKEQAIKTDINTGTAAARQAALEAEESAAAAQASAAEAVIKASEAMATATSVEGVIQNFWVDDIGIKGEPPTGSIYITTTPKKEYCNAPSGRATIITSTGFIMQESETLVTLTDEVTAGDITEYSIDPDVFRAKTSALAGVYEFKYEYSSEEELWYWVIEGAVNIEDYGIEITGTVEEDTVLEITLAVGSTNTTVLTAFTSNGDVISSGNYIGHNEGDTEIDYEISDATISAFVDAGMPIASQPANSTSQVSMANLAENMLTLNAINKKLMLDEEIEKEGEKDA